MKTNLYPQLASALLVGLTGISSASAQAADYYLQANQSVDYTTLSTWFDQSSGGGNNATTLNGNTFYSNGYRVRGSTNTAFGDAGTTLKVNSTFLVRNTDLKVANFETYGGGATLASGTGGAMKLTVTSYVNAAGTLLRSDDGGANRSINLTASTVTGAGDFTFETNADGLGYTFNGGNISGFSGDLVFTGFRASATNVVISATDTSGYSGDVRWNSGANAIVNFNGAFSSTGSLLLTSTSRLVLDESISFGAVSLDGGSTFLSSGTYSYNELLALNADIFAGSTAGSITVGTIPEPSSLAMIAGAAALLCVNARKRDRSAP